MRLKPDEFWRMTPGQYILMLEGVLMQRRWERSNHVEGLHLQRYLIAVIMNFAGSFSKGSKRVDSLDIWSIPEIDGQIKAIRAKDKEEFEKRADAVLEKYKRLSNVGQGHNADRSAGDETDDVIDSEDAEVA